MSEYKKGYDLGKKLQKDQCKRICREWNKLEKQVLPLLGKNDSRKTKEEKQLELDYELFWENKVVQITQEKEVDDKFAEGFKKAILEKCSQKKTRS